MRVEKLSLGNYVTDVLKESSYLFFIRYQGLTVAQISALRAKLDAAGAHCTVIKNTYIRLGLLNNGHTLPESLELAGDTAVVHGVNDPCPVAKVIKAFGKDHERITFKGGLVEGDFLTSDDCLALAELPPKEILQAQLLGVLEAPKTYLVRVLNAKVSSIVYCIQAYRDKIEQAS